MPIYSFFLKRAGEAQSERKKEARRRDADGGRERSGLKENEPANSPHRLPVFPVYPARLYLRKSGADYNQQCPAIRRSTARLDRYNTRLDRLRSIARHGEAYSPVLSAPPLRRQRSRSAENALAVSAAAVVFSHTAARAFSVFMFGYCPFYAESAILRLSHFRVAPMGD